MSTRSEPTSRPQGIPFRPVWPAPPPPGQALVRAVVARAVNVSDRSRWAGAEAVCKTFWPSDDVAPLLINRGAVSPMSTTSSGALALASTAVADFVSTLPSSAASKLIAAGQMLSLDGLSVINLPKITTPFVPAFVTEGAPAPVAQLVMAADPLGPMHKMMILTAFTLELMQRSDVESVVRQALLDSTAMALDSILFCDAAAAGAAPAGLLEGSVRRSPSCGRRLRSHVGRPRGPRRRNHRCRRRPNIVVVMNPVQALRLALSTQPAPASTSRSTSAKAGSSPPVA